METNETKIPNYRKFVTCGLVLQGDMPVLQGGMPPCKLKKKAALNKKSRLTNIVRPPLVRACSSWFGFTRGHAPLAHQSSVVAHQSPVVAHQSPVEAYQSPVEAHQSPVGAYQSPVEAHQSSVGAHWSSEPSLKNNSLIYKSVYRLDEHKN